MIKIYKTSNNRLTRHTYEFRYEYEELRYTCCMYENRNSVKDKWPTEIPKLSYKEWCKTYDEPDDYYDDEEDNPKYRKYEIDIEKFMGGTTKDGRVKYGGTASRMLNHLPSCPDSIAKKAKQLFIKTLVVTYK